MYSHQTSYVTNQAQVPISGMTAFDLGGLFKPRNTSPSNTQEPQSIQLHKAIAELPDTYQEAIILNELEGLTLGEISEKTGLSLPTIRIRLFRAKKRLRRILRPV